MKQRVLHTASLLLLMAAAFQSLVSCVYDDLEIREDDDKAVLVIRTEPLESRSATTDMENLNSLRVIILHANGTLEENYHVSDLGGAESHTHIFKVSGNETKKIYLIANEESIEGVDLNDLGLLPAEKLEAITFSAVPAATTGNPAFSNGIPMSACYELPVGSEPRIDKDFFLVRTMTKFTFSFQNARTDKVKLMQMEVSSFADRTYLIPQFYGAGPDEKVSSEKFMVGALGDYDAASSLFWVDWLKDAVEKSHSDDYLPDDIGWIKNYSLPADAVHEDENTGIKLTLADKVLEAGETWDYPDAFYRCESINLINDKQYYRISYLEVQADRDESPKSWGVSGKLEPVLKLSQVKYLFRHTHVKVDVALGQEDVVIFARIHPWEVIKPQQPLPFEPED